MCFVLRVEFHVARMQPKILPKFPTPHRKLNGPELWFEKATTLSFYCRFFCGNGCLEGLYERINSDTIQSKVT